MEQPCFSLQTLLEQEFFGEYAHPRAMQSSQEAGSQVLEPSSLKRGGSALEQDRSFVLRTQWLGGEIHLKDENIRLVTSGTTDPAADWTQGASVNTTKGQDHQIFMEPHNTSSVLKIVMKRAG